MCIGIPAKVVELAENFVIVDMNGVRREVSTSLLEENLQIGDYVLIHVGFAIAKLNEEEAKETLKILKEITNEIY